MDEYIYKILGKQNHDLNISGWKCWCWKGNISNLF